MTASPSVRTLSLAVAMTLLAACAPRPIQHASTDVSQAPASDSLTLRRTRCFGYCPAYRITVTPSGRITYQTSDPRDSTSAITSSADPSALRHLTARARAIGFFDLPSEIAKDPDLCPRMATDMPTAIVTVFARDTTKEVTDYHGCFVGRDSSMPARLAKLRDFEAEIDSVLGSARFIKAAPSR